MDLCGMCEAQVKKSQKGDPHQFLAKIDEQRIFKSVCSKGYAEQDYQCQVCSAKFTKSTNRNDLAWTLWRG